ncbi:Putative oxidoreductase [hydrothermal vent metagenome]|uniref:Oxidoreductase n=2 Tax=hydrothermal vent metagenome TaxID=652676 RepID=A0A3B0VEG9_9ZZZZ
MDLQTIDKLLTSTRSVRKRLDLERPIPPEIIEECLEIAIQAPTGGNAQGWHFMIVSDAGKKAQIGQLYKESFFIYARDGQEQAQSQGSREQNADQQARVVKSAVYLAQNMHKVPLMVIPCIEGRVESLDPMTQAGLYGSILPAAWSFMFALRARGLGAAWTTLHLRYENEIADILGIPKSMTQAALLPVAYYTGEDFKPAKRMPATDVTSWNSWGSKR